MIDTAVRAKGIGASEIAAYSASPGLSNSMMRDLAVSPLRMWHKWINPNREIEEPTPEMQFGTALHCAILEPDKFAERFVCELEPPENCLDTMEELRAFIRDRGLTPKGTRKAEAIAQVQAIDPNWPILDVLKTAYLAEHGEKVIFTVEDWARIGRCEMALREQSAFSKLLEAGKCEVALFGTEPETGVPLKGRLDWMTPKVTLDIKTFSQKRGKSIDKSVTDAIYYEQYYRQAYIYALLRGWPKTWSGDHILAFVESEEPHEVRLRALRGKSGGEANLYWMRAGLEVRGFCRVYAEHLARFGEKPWLETCSIDVLVDEEMPQLAW